jgi:hypothetical protein
MANDSAKTVRLEPADFRVDSFDARVEGVEPIRRGGTDVPEGKAQAVRDAAKEHGVALKTAKG